MAVLQKIKTLFVQSEYVDDLTDITPAPPTTYDILPLTFDQLTEVMKLNNRCFRNGENYTKSTFKYLLREPTILSYRAVAATGEMAGFMFAMLVDSGTAHLTTIGVSPEHRRRGIAERLLEHLHKALSLKDITTLVLEVRISNINAQRLYERSGYSIVQRIANYYNNGEDCYLMIKALQPANS